MPAPSRSHTTKMSALENSSAVEFQIDYFFFVRLFQSQTMIHLTGVSAYIIFLGCTSPYIDPVKTTDRGL